MEQLPTAAHSFLLSIQACVLFLCVFSIVYLSFRKWENNKWLLLAFFGVGWFMLNLQLGFRGYKIIAPSIAFPSLSSMLLVFPSIYLYVRKLIAAKEIAARKWLPHFMPFLVFFIWFLLVGDPSAKMVAPLNIPLPFMVMTVVLAVTSLLYNFWIYRLFQFNQLKYQDEYSDDNVFITLDWLKWMIWVLAFLPVLGVSNLLFGPLLGGIPASGLTHITILLYCSMLSFFSFRQPILYQEGEMESMEEPTDQQLEAVERQQSSKSKITLDKLEADQLISKLEKYMLEQKPFLNPKIRMPELAAELAIPRHVFSHLINEHYRMNFFGFINKYRVEYAVELLQSDASQQYSLEAIGQMAGFNSKSTFNSRFKEIMGKTPSKWLGK